MYTTAVDMWAAGVCLYILLSGCVMVLRSLGRSCLRKSSTGQAVSEYACRCDQSVPSA